MLLITPAQCQTSTFQPVHFFFPFLFILKACCLWSATDPDISIFICILYSLRETLESPRNLHTHFDQRFLVSPDSLNTLRSPHYITK